MADHIKHNSDHNSDRDLDREDADRTQLERFKKDLASDADVMLDQRQSANEDMRFVTVEGGTWEDFLEDNDNTTSGIRIKLELDLVSNYINRFIGEWRENRAGIEYKSNSQDTTSKDSDLLNGIYRSDFLHFGGKVSTDQAVDEVATVGYGAIKLATVFEDPEDSENDNQNIEWRPIYNASNTVFWDKSAQYIDKRDARRCQVLKQFSKESFKLEYPGKEPVSAYIPDQSKQFSNPRQKLTDHTDIIYVATRYEVVEKKQTMFVYNDLATSKVVSFEEEQETNETLIFVREREIKIRQIEKTVFSGEDILEATRRIAGKHIPIIPFYGHRAYVDGAEWYHGLVRKLKDAARLFNVQVSQLAENAASSGSEIPVFDTSQIQGDEMMASWANLTNKPFLFANALRGRDGEIAHVGPIHTIKPAQLDGSTATLLTIVPQFIRDVTGGSPQEVFKHDMSGKAIREARKITNMNTHVINDNIANAIIWSGVVYQAIAAEVYTTPRIVKTITQDGTEGEAQLLNQVMDEDEGTLFVGNDLRGKKFQVYPDIGPQYETLQEQTVEDLKGMFELIGDNEAGAQYLPVMISILMDNITGVGLGPLKDFNRKIMLQQGIVKPVTPEEEQMLADVQEQTQQPDPNEKLIDAAAQQQEAEARNLDAKTIKDTADAIKKVAETEKIRDEIGIPRERLALDADSAILNLAQKGLGE